MELQELSTLSYIDFKNYLNLNFNITFQPHVVMSAELIEVTEFNNYSPLERKPFAIVFRTAQKSEYYPQATFVVEHPQKGEMLMFLSPKGLSDKGMMYEAVFS